MNLVRQIWQKLKEKLKVTKKMSKNEKCDEKF